MISSNRLLTFDKSKVNNRFLIVLLTSKVDKKLISTRYKNMKKYLLKLWSVIKTFVFKYGRKKNHDSH